MKNSQRRPCPNQKSLPRYYGFANLTDTHIRYNRRRSHQGIDYARHIQRAPRRMRYRWEIESCAKLS